MKYLNRSLLIIFFSFLFGVRELNFLDNLFDAESLVDLVGLIGLNEGFD